MAKRSRSFACIISSDSCQSLVGIAHQFAPSIEVLEDGILFDVSGLERLMGKPQHVAQKILQIMQRQNVAGSVAVADTLDTAVLLARQEEPQKKQAKACTL